MEELRSSIGDATTSFGASVERGLGIGAGNGGGIEEEESGRRRGGGGGGGDSPRRGGKLLFGVANVGGSLTVLLQIALVAWGVRRLRSMLENRRQRLERERAEAAARRDAHEAAALQSSSSSLSAPSPFRPVDRVPFASLSPVAVRRLVEFDPVRYVFVDVRFPAVVKDSPAPFEAVLSIPESELSASLQLSEAEWEGRYPSVRKIGLNDIIVFLSSKGHRAQRAANVAAGLGYSGCCILSGGIEAYSAAKTTHVDVPLKFLSRDAVATLLEKHRKDEEIAGSSSIRLLDVRRNDERTNFGHIKGSQNVPVTEFPKALTLDDDEWEKSFHFPKIAEADTLIFQCRANGRASWAAQLAHDAGFKRCFIYKDGILGWHLDPTVQPYHPYKVGDSPPDPIEFEVETVDHEAAEEELQKLGLG